MIPTMPEERLAQRLPICRFLGLDCAKQAERAPKHKRGKKFPAAGLFRSGIPSFLGARDKSFGPDGGCSRTFVQTLAQSSEISYVCEGTGRRREAGVQYIPDWLAACTNVIFLFFSASLIVSTRTRTTAGLVPSRDPPREDHDPDLETWLCLLVSHRGYGRFILSFLFSCLCISYTSMRSRACGTEMTCPEGGLLSNTNSKYLTLNTVLVKRPAAKFNSFA